MAEFIPTSVARRLITRMQATHDRRRVSVFAGPPGIGKTTAIDQFCAANPGGVAVVKVARRPAKEVLVLQHCLEAIRRLSGASGLVVPSSIWELRNYLMRSFCDWAGLDQVAVRQGEPLPVGTPPLTIVFDEAQNLAREAIEVLRFWNDADRCYAPFPVGLIFVGNNEFSLSGKAANESVISAAVADRALYLQTLDYDDVTDDDLRLFVEAHAAIDEAAAALLLRSFRTPRSPRSLRRLGDLLDELATFSAGPAITADDVRLHVELTAA